MLILILALSAARGSGPAHGQGGAPGTRLRARPGLWIWARALAAGDPIAWGGLGKGGKVENLRFTIELGAPRPSPGPGGGPGLWSGFAP